MANHSPAVGDPIIVRSGRRVVNLSRPVKDATGRIRAVLTVGPVLDGFQDTLKLHALPPGSAISIINQQGVVIASDRSDWIGQRGDWGHLAERLAAKEGSDVSRWIRRDNVERVNGFTTAHRVPWLVTVGVPTDIAYAALAGRLEWGALIIIGKGLTPIPYKLVTITSGFAGFNVWLFVLCSIIARGVRFFVAAILLNRYGDWIRVRIEKHLAFWVFLGAAVLVLGFLIVYWLL